MTYGKKLKIHAEMRRTVASQLSTSQLSVANCEVARYKLTTYEYPQINFESQIDIHHLKLNSSAFTTPCAFILNKKHNIQQEEWTVWGPGFLRQTLLRSQFWVCMQSFPACFLISILLTTLIYNFLHFCSHIIGSSYRCIMM